MADQLKDLVLRLTADSRQLVAELRKVESGNSRTTKRIESDWKKTSSTISSSFSKLPGFAGLGALTGGLSVAGLSAFASDAVEAGDAIDKLAGQLGISTTALQEYQFAADLSGVSQEQFSVGLRTLGRNLGLAAVGTGEAKTAFEALGISVRDSSGQVRTIEAVFEDVLRSLGQVEDAAVATALAQRILGESGAVFVNLAGDLDGLIARARELGIAIDEDVIRSMVATKDAGTELSAVLDQRLSRSMELVSIGTLAARERMVAFVESVTEAIERSSLLSAALERITPVRLLDDLAAVDRQSAATRDRIEDLQRQIRQFRELNAGQPAAVVERQLNPLFKKLTSEIDLLERLFEQRSRLTQPELPATGPSIQLDASALDPSKGKEAARKAAAEAKAAAREVEAAQQRLNSVIEASFSPAEKLLSNLEEISADYRAGKISAEQFAEGQEAVVRQLDALDEKAQTSALRELDQILQAGLTPAEKLIEQLDRIGQLYAEGSISAEQFGQAQASIEKQIKDIELDQLKDSLKDLQGVADGVFEGMTGALADFVLTGKADLASLTASFAREFIQIGIKSGVSTLFGNLFGSIGSVPGRATGGPVAAGRPYIVGENGPELLVPKSAGFVIPNMASRGGRGAAVMAMAPPPPVVVNIHNSSRSDVQANERLGPSGTREIEILVTELVARDIARGGSSGRAVDRRFGVRPRGA